MQTGNSLTLSAFSQYKGELVISLKYVTETKAAGEKPRGEQTVYISSFINILTKDISGFSFYITLYMYLLFLFYFINYVTFFSKIPYEILSHV